AHIDRGKLCFVIKEAAFKAYYPATAYLLDFDQVFVEIMGDHEARVLLPAETAPDLYGHRFIDVRFSQTDDMLAAIAFREAGSPTSGRARRSNSGKVKAEEGCEKSGSWIENRRTRSKKFS
ncbi:MAG: hypothetical protein AAFR57_17005, partial [Pseudomonadota bacterium]